MTGEELGIYDDMHPRYTVFNKGNKNFSGIWSYFSEDYAEFLKSYEADAEKYSKSTRYAPKDGTPVNSFNINVFDEGKFLLPVFTMGKYFERDGKHFPPLSIQVHHAVCDGYHVRMFAERLQGYVNLFNEDSL